eukprot:6186597-Pleurochrysis_carterae.AAC.5
MADATIPLPEVKWYQTPLRFGTIKLRHTIAHCTLVLQKCGTKTTTQSYAPRDANFNNYLLNIEQVSFRICCFYLYALVRACGYGYYCIPSCQLLRPVCVCLVLKYAKHLKS